jgi:hypothetical protein
MTAEQLINYMIPPLKKNDEVSRALHWMEEFRVKELPVVHEGKLLGFVNEDILFDNDHLSADIGELPLLSLTCQVAPWQHYYDLLKVLKDHKMGMIAVVDDDLFRGVVIIEDILNEFAQTAMVNTPGAIITIQASLKDYSLSEISRIVEMNDSTIVGVNIKPTANDPSQIDIVIRINNQDVNQISSGLVNHGYLVTSSFNSEDKSFDEKERYNMLMKFLES